jgi:hypothetical protein
MFVLVLFVTLFKFVLFAIGEFVAFVILELDEERWLDVEFVPDDELFVLVETALVDVELDELVVLDIPVFEVPFAKTGTTVEFDVPNDVVPESPEDDPIEKAYWGKISIAAIETKRKILRSILHHLWNSTNKELLYIVQEQCY